MMWRVLAAAYIVVSNVAAWQHKSSSFGFLVLGIGCLAVADILKALRQST